MSSDDRISKAFKAWGSAESFVKYVKKALEEIPEEHRTVAQRVSIERCESWLLEYGETQNDY